MICLMHLPAIIPLAILSLALIAPAQAKPKPDPKEVQSHGVVFEKWIRDTFFNHYQPVSYTQKWDIPKEANLLHGGIPVNPKAARYGGAVDMGDAIRQFDIDEPFLLIIGYWKEGDQNKRYVKIVAPVVSPELWRKLWGPIRREDLVRLDAIVKDRSVDYRESRRQALALKAQVPFSEATMILNPKIDGYGQRRLQCSLSFAQVMACLVPGTKPEEEPSPSLFGVPVPGPFYSPPRKFDKAAPANPAKP